MEGADSINHYIAHLAKNLGDQYMSGSYEEELKSVLHNKFRYMQIFEILDKLFKQHKGRLKVLDMGTSPLTFMVKRRYPLFEISTIDYAEKFKKRSVNEGIKFKKVDLAKNPIKFPQKRYDVILFLEVLEHLRHNHRGVLLQIARSLTKGGVCVIQTPNKLAPKALVADKLLARFWKTQTLVVEKAPEFDHFKEFSLRELKRLLTTIPQTRVVQADYHLYFDYPETAMVYRKNSLFRFIFVLNFELVKYVRFLRRGMQCILIKT